MQRSRIIGKRSCFQHVNIRKKSTLSNFTHLDSADCKFFTDNKVAARTALPQIWDKPVSVSISWTF